MSRKDVVLHKAETNFEQLEKLHSDISQKAFERFCDHSEGPTADWLSAERELVWTPAIEMRQKDGHIEVRAATPGVHAKDLDVQITPDDLLIRAGVHHHHTPDEGTIAVCEFKPGQLFRSVHFPEPVKPDTANAQYHDGMLVITADLAAPPAQTRIVIARS